MPPGTLIPYAHTLKNHAEDRWEPLDTHLCKVAEPAGAFADRFGAKMWGEIAGRCHDLGKASTAFQKYIRFAPDANDAGEEVGSPSRVDHSTFGGRYVSEKIPGPSGQILAFCILGHHAGLPNSHIEDNAKARSTLQSRLSTDYSIEPVEDPKLDLAPPPWKKFVCFTPEEGAFTLAFFTRMLFSCLIDADRICTEAFCDSEKAKDRQIERPSLLQLRKELDCFLERKQQKAEATTVNEHRRTILRRCVEAAAGAPGFYSLQVPTGGGKTLSSLAFALHHAGETMSRVVVAIPFTSIIEQTADVYREALGPFAVAAVIEHHTNIRPERDTRANQLASENWDAPLIITTNVQLLESLFAAATTPCRKLHRLANSIIILDEAQTLPVELLAPTLRALRELVDNYGCTVVLCTATQPALLYRKEDFTIGIRNVQSIITEPVPLFTALNRVKVQHIGQLSDDDLVFRMAAEKRVLCIVNTKVHAAELFRRLQELCAIGTVFHLSTRMCGAHRLAALKEIRRRLAPDAVEVQETRIVSTSLIEAGVDLDLPVVYRAAAGFDSIAQAAGRCNREGRLERGMVYVFDAEDQPPAGIQRDGAGIAKELWPRYKDDPLSPDAVEHYFRSLYWKHEDRWDKKKVLQCMSREGPNRSELRFQFRDMAERYVLIRDNQLPIVVPYDENAQAIIEELQSPWVDFVSHRRLQPYLVSVPKYVADRLVRDHVIVEHPSGVGILLREDLYTHEAGLNLERAGVDERVLIA